MDPESTKKPGSEHPARRFGDVVPSPETEDELRWFFNEAEIDTEQPSNYCVLLSGMSPTSLAAEEQRAEAMHAAGKIRVRLQALSTTDALILAGLYLKLPRSRRVREALGDLAGALEAFASFRAEYLLAFARSRTTADSVAEWLEELVDEGGAAAVAHWRRDVERACAIAVRAYERVRGKGPSVAPEREPEDEDELEEEDEDADGADPEEDDEEQDEEELEQEER